MGGVIKNTFVIAMIQSIEAVYSIEVIKHLQGFKCKSQENFSLSDSVSSPKQIYEALLYCGERCKLWDKCINVDKFNYWSKGYFSNSCREMAAHWLCLVAPLWTKADGCIINKAVQFENIVSHF